MLSRISLAVGLALVASGLVTAQEVVQETRTTTTTPGGGKTTEIRRVSQLIGSNVRLQGVDNYGKVEDVVLDDNGGIGYLVVSKGGRYAMMPWSAADINYGQRVVTYDVAPQAVQPLFFDQNAWPTISDQQFTTRMRQVFPGTRAVRRESLRPVDGTLPAPGGPVIQEKVKLKRNGDIKVREKVK
jgi:sporulation protein YlmC with PRC-barrel domain